MLPFLFTTLKRRLGTEDTKWWSVSGVILSHSVGNSTGSSLSHLRFKCATHSLLETGRDCRQASQVPVPLPPQPGLCMCAECGFALSCWNMHGRPWKKMSSWRQHIVLQNLYVLFSINGAITEVQVTFAKGTDTTPYHDRPWLLDLLLVTVWMILFFFGPEHTASIPPKKYLKYWFIWPQYTFPLCDGPSRCLRTQRSRRRFWTLLT